MAIKKKKMTKNGMRMIHSRVPLGEPKQIPSTFKNPVFWVATFIFLALIMYSTLKQIEKANVVLPAPMLGSGDEAICGNGLIESGENCATCFIDAPCDSGEACSAGVCLKKKFNLLVLTIPAILLSILAIALLSYQIFEFKGQRGNGETQRISELVDYISESLGAGQLEGEIMINVISAGWDKADAEKAFREAKKLELGAE